MLKRYAGRHGAHRLHSRLDRSCWNASEMQECHRKLTLHKSNGRSDPVIDRLGADKRI